MSMSLLLKKCLARPIMDLALLIRAFTLASSLSSTVISEPKYLKLWVNRTRWLLGRTRSGGRLPSAFHSFAFFRELGKNIASVFDLVLLRPTCICIPSLSKCWTRIGIRVSRSSRLSMIKTLSSTK